MWIDQPVPKVNPKESTRRDLPRATCASHSSTRRWRTFGWVSQPVYLSGDCSQACSGSIQIQRPHCVVYLKFAVGVCCQSSLIILIIFITCSLAVRLFDMCFPKWPCVGKGCVEIGKNEAFEDGDVFPGILDINPAGPSPSRSRALLWGGQIDDPWDGKANPMVPWLREKTCSLYSLYIPILYIYNMCIYIYNYIYIISQKNK